MAFPCYLSSRRAHVLDALQIQAPPGDGHAGGAPLRRQHHHRIGAPRGGEYPGVRAGPGGGHRERGAVRDVSDRGERGIAHGVRERRRRAPRAGRRSDHRHQLCADDARRGGPPPSDDRPAQRRQLDPRDAHGRPNHAHRNPLGVAVTQPATSTEPRAVLRDHAPVATRPATGRPTVVIVGAGFGGLRAARALRKSPVNVVLVDRHNYHLFQPLLYQVATAGLEPEDERRRAGLPFVVVGGGPTGVEMAGALSELIRLVLVKDYPRLNVKDVRVLLLEATDRLLAAMPAKLRDAAAETLWRKHVEVRFGATVADYDGARVLLKSGEVIPACTLIWAAGVKAVSLTGRLGLPTAQQGRVPVEPTLEVPGHPDIYVIGDASYLEVAGAPLPMMAPVAIQMAETAVANIRRRITGEPPVAFRYRDPGSLATIGRNAAVAYIRGIGFTGFPAWVVWLVVHIIQLIGFRNKVFVLLNWAWDYFFYERAARLITSME